MAAPAQRAGLSPLRRWRLTGLAGTGLLAAGAYLSGALPGAAPAGRAEALWGTGPGFRIGLAAYLAGLILLGWAWWAIGARLRAGAGPPLRWVLVTGALWAAPLLVAPPLGSRDLYAYACQGAVWLDGHDPYAVGAAGGGCPWLEAVPQLWQESAAPYGPVALLASAGAVAVARALTGGPDGPVTLLASLAGLRLVAVAGAVLVAAYGPRLARHCGVDPAAAAWLGLVTPLVAVHAVSGAHNDALVAGLVVAGLALAAHRRDAGSPTATAPLGGVALAGVALGLAVAVKVTALAALPFALLLVGGPRRPGSPAWLLGGAAVAGFAGSTLVTGLGTGWVGALSGTGSLAQWSSPPTGLGMAAGYVLRGLGAPGAYDPAVAVARGLGLLALVVVSAGLLLRAYRRRADPAVVVTLAGAVLAAVVLLGPVVYPWYAVTPLAVLAASIRRPVTRRGLAVATLVLTGLVLPSGLGVPVLTKGPGAVAVAAGWLIAAVLVIRWWRRRRQPPAARPAPPPGRPAPGRPAPGQ